MPQYIVGKISTPNLCLIYKTIDLKHKFHKKINNCKH